LILAVAASPAGGRWRWKRLLVVLALGACAVAPPGYLLWKHRYGPEAKAAQWHAQAKIFLRIGKPDRAVRALEQSLALSPGNADRHADLALALLMSGDRTRGRAELLEACRLEPDAIEPRLRLAALETEERRFPEARRHLDWLNDPGRSARARPWSEAIALLTYRAAYSSGDLSAALASSDAALAAAPRSMSMILARAGAMLAAGDAEGACAVLDRGAGMDAGSVPLALLLSRAREQRGDARGAMAALAGLPEAKRASAEVVSRRAEIAAAQGDPGAVMAELQALEASRDESGAAEYATALVSIARGDLRTAVAPLRQALAKNPRHVQGRLELAKALAASDDIAGARAQLRAALDDDPLSRTARLQLARVTLLDGNAAGAADAAEALVRSSPEDMDAIRLLIAARARQGDLPAAQRFFAELEKRHATSRSIGLARNLSWLASLDLDKAVAGSERLLTSSPGARGALEVLATAYAAKRGLADALERLRVFASADPRYSPLRLEIAGVYAALGRLDLAEEEVRGVLSADPQLAPAYLALASIAEARRDLDTAARVAEDYLARRPDDLAGRSLLARVLIAKGKWVEALTLAERPVPPILSGRDRLHALSLDRAGFAAAVELGDLERGRARIERSRGLDGSASLTALAAAAFALGRDGDAARIIEERIGDAELRRAAQEWAARPGSPTSTSAPTATATSAPTATAAMEAPPTPGSEDADAWWISGALALSDGRHEVAIARLARCRPGTSLPKTLALADARLLHGERPAAIEAAASLADERKGERGRPGPIFRALREHAATTTKEKAARLAGPLQRLLVATSYGFKGAALSLARDLRPDAVDVPLAALLVSRALDESGDPSGAREVLEEAARRRPRSVPVLEGAGILLVEQGAYREAAQLLERATAIAPEEPRLRLFSGIAREQTGQRSAAIQSYREAIALDPDSALAHGNLAWLLAYEGKAVDDAIVQALRARELSPGNARAHDALGLARLLRENTSEALESLTRARDLAPTEPRVRYHLALAYRRLGEPARALAELDMAVLLGPETEEGTRAAALRDEILDAMSGGKRAGATFEKAGRLAPGDAVEDSLGKKGKRHAYRVDVAAEGGYVLRYRAPADSATGIELTRRVGSAARLVKRAAARAGEDIEWRLRLGEGTYGIEIVVAGAASVQRYTLSVAIGEPAADADREPNDFEEDAAPLDIGVVAKGRAGVAGDLDVYRVVAPGSDGVGADAGLVDLRIAAAAGAGVDVRLLEVAPDGAIPLKRFTVASGRSALVPALRAPPSGLLVEVASASGSAEAAYELDLRTFTQEGATTALLEPDDTPARAHALPAASSDATQAARAVRRRGTISPAQDRDMISLPPGRGALEVTAPPALSLSVEVLEAGGTEESPRVAASLRVEPGVMRRIASLRGGLLVAISAADPGAASDEPYEVTWGPPTEGAIDLEPNDVPARAAPYPSVTATALLHSASDRDVFRLEGAQRAASISVRALEVAVTIVRFSLGEGEVRRVEARAEAGPGASARLPAPTGAGKDAALFIEVAPAAGSAGGSYELSGAAGGGR